MKSMSATEVRQNFSSVISAVESEPVTISKQDKNIAVIVSSARYDELSRMEDRLYGKMAELAIKEGFASDNEAESLLNSL